MFQDELFAKITAGKVSFEHCSWTGVHFTVTHSYAATCHTPSLPSPLMQGVSPHAKHLVKALLEVDPSKRLSAKQVWPCRHLDIITDPQTLQHPWIVAQEVPSFNRLPSLCEGE